MNPDEGRFVDEKDAEAWMPRFTIGEIIKVKGEEFQVVRIEERELALKPLSAQDRMLKAIKDGALESMNRHERRRMEALERRSKPRADAEEEKEGG